MNEPLVRSSSAQVHQLVAYSNSYTVRSGMALRVILFGKSIDVCILPHSLHTIRTIRNLISLGATYTIHIRVGQME